MLVDHALNRFSSDNLSCMIVRMDAKGNFGQKAPSSEKDSTGSDVIVEESAEKGNKVLVDGGKSKSETQAKDADTKEKTSEEPVPASAPS